MGGQRRSHALNGYFGHDHRGHHAAAPTAPASVRRNGFRQARPRGGYTAAVWRGLGADGGADPAMIKDRLPGHLPYFGPRGTHRGLPSSCSRQSRQVPRWCRTSTCSKLRRTRADGSDPQSHLLADVIHVRIGAGGLMVTANFADRGRLKVDAIPVTLVE